MPELTPTTLADLVEHHTGLFVQALRRLDSGAPGPHALDDLDGYLREATVDVGGEGLDVPQGAWEKVGELENETYTWPHGTEEYEPFEVWERQAGDARVQLGVGRPK